MCERGEEYIGGVGCVGEVCVYMILLDQGRLAAVDRWLPHTVTTIDMFHWSLHMLPLCATPPSVSFSPLPPQITIIQWTSIRRESSAVKSAQFKLSERGIRIFPKGLSPAVL